MLTTYQKQAKTKLITAVISVAVIAGVMVLAEHARGKKPSTVSVVISGAGNSVTMQPTPSRSSISTNSAPTSGSYKNGSFSATVSYYVPTGPQTIKVNLTLNNGVITSSSVQNSEGDPTSAAYQESFASSYKTQVVGKKISGLQLNYVGGASDTTQGFNAAIDQIANQAKA